MYGCWIQNNFRSCRFCNTSSNDCDCYISVSDNDYIGIKTIDFLDYNEIEVLTISDNGPNCVEIRIGNINRTLISNIRVPNSNSNWITIKVTIKKIIGKNYIFLIFKGLNKSSSK